LVEFGQRARYGKVAQGAASPRALRARRILGQIAGQSGEIIEARTGKVVVPAPGQTVPAGDGLGDGEDRLELVEDMPLPCSACCGSGRQRIGFRDRTEPCDDCGGSGTLQ
jgi:hypothetical protein